MPEDKKERTNSQLKTQVEELTRVQIKILEAIAKIEEHTGEDFMEAGEYHGLSFE